MAITKIQSESLNLSDNYDFTGTVTGAGESNTPYWRAYTNSTTTFSQNTNTTVPFNATLFDSASGFNTSTHKYTIPTGQCGKYFLLTSLRLNNNPVDNQIAVYFIVNSSEKSFSNKTVGGGYPTVIHSDILSLNAGDDVFVRIYAQLSSPGLDGGGSSITTTFEGFKIST